jgi:hypothetical protein
LFSQLHFQLRLKFLFFFDQSIQLHWFATEDKREKKTGIGQNSMKKENVGTESEGEGNTKSYYQKP